MIDEKNTTVENQEEQEIDIMALLFKYLFYWKWFVASVVVCCTLAFVCLRFQIPAYEVSSSVLIKEDDKKGSSAASSLSAIQDLGMLSMTSNFDNEIEILKSRTLVKKVVKDLELYINVSEPHTFGYATPLYKQSPLAVYLSPEEADKLKGVIKLYLHCDVTGKLLVEGIYKEGHDERKLSKTFDKLPAVLPTSVGVITITCADTTRVGKEDLHLEASIHNLTATAMGYVNAMSVTPTSKTTTIAKVSVKNSVKVRGIDFINSLVANYNRDANDEKNEVAQKTADFIQERIGIINRELGSTENKLANFKQKSGLTNLTSDAQMALQESSKYEQQSTENATQIRLVQFLNNYINDPVNKDEVLPVNVGLKDESLSAVINQYNTMIIERKRLLRTSSENNPAVIHINTGIEAMRRNVRTTVNSVLKGLEIAQADIARQTSKFETRISNAPKQEKEFLSISRQQEIQAALYIMLLQKREENAITLASTANNGRMIEEPMAGIAPVAPKKPLIMLAALILGLALPVGGIFIVDLTRYKIEDRGDVEKITKVPVIGELPLSNAKALEGAIMLRENHNDLMEETFRNFRTNLLFMLENDEKVILFTSTQPGEGKSFVAGNVAVSLAYLGKKVLVMGMDIRKPGLNKVFNLSKHAKGITDYLVNPEHTDLFSLIQHADFTANLDILPGGTIPPNPTELVARDTIVKVIEMLKERYDYIILDTAPIAMVTDTAIISRVADMGVYVCRADETPKAAFGYINVLNEEKRFKKLAIAINGLDLIKRKYGYGSKYGYGKHYGYGYGYGYGYENKNKK